MNYPLKKSSNKEGIGGKAAFARDENTATLSKVNRLLQVVSQRLERERERER